MYRNSEKTKTSAFLLSPERTDRPETISPGFTSTVVFRNNFRTVSDCSVTYGTISKFDLFICFFLPNFRVPVHINDELSTCYRPTLCALITLLNRWQRSVLLQTTLAGQSGAKLRKGKLSCNIMRQLFPPTRRPGKCSFLTVIFYYRALSHSRCCFQVCRVEGRPP